ncbi:MAG: hypothetical protein R2867_39435 [Caldilineaceae bacterium]
MQIVQGRLHAAIRTYEQALALAKQQGDSRLLGTADLHLGLSELYREQDGCSRRRALTTERRVGAASGASRSMRITVAWCRRDESRNKATWRALRLLDEAEDRFLQVHIPDFRPVAALKVRVDCPRPVN